MCTGNKVQISVGLIFIVVLLFASCSAQSDERNKINFQDSSYVVQDSLIQMNHYLDKINSTETINFFFDNEGYLFICNIKIGRMSVGDKIDFLDVVQKHTGLTSEESFRFVSLALFLKSNYLSGCFKHRVFGVYLYDYRQTLENDYENQRFIMLFDSNTKNIKGNYMESYQVIERKGNLLLIALSDVKIE